MINLYTKFGGLVGDSWGTRGGPILHQKMQRINNQGLTSEKFGGPIFLSINKYKRLQPGLAALSPGMHRQPPAACLLSLFLNSFFLDKLEKRRQGNLRFPGPGGPPLPSVFPGRLLKSLLKKLYKVPAGKERILPVKEGQEGAEIPPGIK